MAKKRKNFIFDLEFIKIVEKKCIDLGTDLTKVITNLLEGWVK